jgi:hypothetical protein
VAWLSDATVDAPDRPPPGIKFVKLDGVTVASNAAQLKTGTLSSAIDRDEFNQETGAVVWTGTSSDGTKNASRCSEWNSTSDIGMAGVSTSTDATWTQNGGGAGCAASLPLYCFEQ